MDKNLLILLAHVCYLAARICCDDRPCDEGAGGSVRHPRCALCLRLRTS